MTPVSSGLLTLQQVPNPDDINERQSQLFSLGELASDGEPFAAPAGPNTALVEEARSNPP